MENHPIPQDVTGFKFKLIGSITVKQFLYLLAGGALALIVYLLPGNLAVKLPFMVTFFGIGASLAFLPVEGRPMDVMFINFIKTLPSENQYIYRKRGANLALYAFLQPPAPTESVQKDDGLKNENDTKRSLLLSQLRAHYEKPDERELAFIKNIKGYFDTSEIKNVKLPDLLPQENISPQDKPQIMQATVLQHEEPQKAEQDIAQLQPIVQAPVAEPPTQVISEPIPTAQITPPTVTAPEPVRPVGAAENARIVAPQDQPRAGFPTIPDIPNVILGIVKDPRGKVLPNILVEVVDQNNIPVRAFKTNALGQFASATPLSAGTYKMFFEDTQKVHEFEAIEIILTDEIFNPLEIFSVDQREKLRQELFGTSASSARQQPIATA